MTYTEAINSANVVLVEFFASWCPHCQRMMPIVDEVKQILGDSAKVIQLDIDQNQETANEVGVEGIPTFIVYKNGKEEWRQSGEMPGEEIVKAVEKVIKG